MPREGFAPGKVKRCMWCICHVRSMLRSSLPVVLVQGESLSVSRINRVYRVTWCVIGALHVEYRNQYSARPTWGRTDLQGGPGFRRLMIQDGSSAAPSSSKRSLSCLGAPHLAHTLCVVSNLRSAQPPRSCTVMLLSAFPFSSFSLRLLASTRLTVQVTRTWLARQSRHA